MVNRLVENNIYTDAKKQLFFFRFNGTNLSIFTHVISN